MLLLRYEQFSLNDYMLYNVPNNQIIPVIISDNGFQLCYNNNDSENIRLHFKVIVYNKPFNYYIDEIYTFINKTFNTINNDWTIIKNERMLNKEHIISLFFFSNKYYIRLNNLKKIIGDLYDSNIDFDESIYYKFNSKYVEYNTIFLPNQTTKNCSNLKKYTICCGYPNSLILTDIDNLVEYN